MARERLTVANDSCRGLKNTPSRCVHKSVLQSMSSSEAQIFLATLRLKTAPASNPSPTDIAVCAEARAPVARQPAPKQMQPPPNLPPPAPEAPAAVPPPSPSPPPPPPSPQEVVRSFQPNDLFAPASRAAAPDAPEVALEETMKEILDMPAEDQDLTTDQAELEQEEVRPLPLKLSLPINTAPRIMHGSDPAMG